MKRVVALVGRPNVGKSTLFNKLSIGTKAIVHDMPGVTRDRKYAKARLGALEFEVVDTPGLEDTKIASIEEQMMGQAFNAVASADVVCLIIDATSSVTPEDEFFAKMLRRVNDNVILIANKCDRDIVIDRSYYKLGFGEPVCISAEHKIGFVELYESLDKMIPDTDFGADPFKSNSVQIAICGRPNAGKSTIINGLLGEYRVLTNEKAGTTRDAITIDWEYKDRLVKLVDTAGVRRKQMIKEKLERITVSDTFNAIRYANVVALVIDATLGIQQQDLNLANFIINEGRALIIVINKWDLVDNHQRKHFKSDIDYKLVHDLAQVKGVPVLYSSAITGRDLDAIIDESFKLYDVWNIKISTSKLNQWLRYAASEHTLPLIKNGRQIRLKYITQIANRPPTFKIFTNYPQKISDSYTRYLVNSMRSDFGMYGTPIRVFFVKSDNPYASKK